MKPRASREDVTVDPDQAGVLARAAAGGDPASWKALVERFSGLVWSVARGYRLSPADAADVFQTTWLRLTENLGRIENPERVGAWLATTARRESLRTVRASARVIPTDDDSVLDLGQVDDRSPEQSVLDSEQAALDVAAARRLWGAFRELSARCQELLRILMATPPPNYLEVASALDMPVGSIGPTRARCLQRLRGKLTDEVSGAVLRPHAHKRA